MSERMGRNVKAKILLILQRAPFSPYIHSSLSPRGDGENQHARSWDKYGGNSVGEARRSRPAHSLLPERLLEGSGRGSSEGAFWTLR